MAVRLLFSIRQQVRDGGLSLKVSPVKQVALWNANGFNSAD